MRMDGNRFGTAIEGDGVRLRGEKIVNELLEEEAPFCDGLPAAELQLAIIVNKHRVAGRLQKDDRHRRLFEHREVVRAQPCRVIEVALAEGRPATTLSPFRQRDVES